MDVENTAYADRLIDDLDDLDWPEAIKEQQRNWIGRSVGAAVNFKVDGQDQQIEVFTTRPDTIYGVSVLVLAPEHDLVKKLTTADQKDAVDKYIEEVSHKSDLERTDLAKTKTGVFTGSYAINPVNGEKIQIWIADYVLSSYEPAQSWLFQLTMIGIMNLPRNLICQSNQLLKAATLKRKPIPAKANTSTLVSWMEWISKKPSIRCLTGWKNTALVTKKVNYRLRDWLFSRQRYWVNQFRLFTGKTAKQRLFRKTNYHWNFQRRIISSRQEQ